MPKTTLIPVLERGTTSYTDDELIGLAARVQALKDSPGWDVMGRLIKDAIIEVQRQGFQNRHEIELWAGKAEGLQMAFDLPKLVLAAAEEVLRREKAQTQKGGPLKAPRVRQEDDDAL